MANAGDEAERQGRQRSDRRRRVGPLGKVGAMGIADRDDRGRGRNERTRRELFARTSKKPGNSGDQPEKSEGANPGDARAFLLPPQRETSLDADEQATGERGCERQRLPIGDRVQLSRSECQRKWSAMKVEMK